MASVHGVSWPIFPVVEVGPVQLYPHDLGIVVAVAAGWWVFRRRSMRRGAWVAAYEHAFLLAIPGILVGSRLGWALPYWLRGQPTPAGELTNAYFTNISSYGGIVGAWLVALLWLRLRRASIEPALDLGMESMVIGLAIARVGDVMVADHLGRQTTSPIGFRVPEGYRFFPNGQCFRAGDVCHQTAAYELIGLCSILAALLLLRRRGVPGALIAGALPIAYGALRFGLVEPFRTSARLAGLTGSQWSSLVIVGVGVWILLRWRRLARPEPLQPASAALEA